MLTVSNRQLVNFIQHISSKKLFPFGSRWDSWGNYGESSPSGLFIYFSILIIQKTAIPRTQLPEIVGTIPGTLTTKYF